MATGLPDYYRSVEVISNITIESISGDVNIIESGVTSFYNTVDVVGGAQGTLTNWLVSGFIHHWIDGIITANQPGINRATFKKDAATIAILEFDTILIIPAHGKNDNWKLVSGERFYTYIDNLDYNSSITTTFRSIMRLAIGTTTT